MIAAELVASLSRIDPTTEVLVAAPGDPSDPPCAGFVYADRSTLTRPVIVLTDDVTHPELQGRPGDLDDDVRPWSDRAPLREYRRAAGTAERADARRAADDPPAHNLRAAGSDSGGYRIVDDGPTVLGGAAPGYVRTAETCADDEHEHEGGCYVRQVPGVPGKCPDEGTCHHQCGDGSCFRVPHCAPLSDYGETWPAEVRAAHAAPNPAWRW